MDGQLPPANLAGAGLTVHFRGTSDDPPHLDLFTRLGAALAGRYRLERELGVGGGWRTVYLAEEAAAGRRAPERARSSVILPALEGSRKR